MKKAITASTGMADTRLVNDFEIFEAAPYSISKLLRALWSRTTMLRIGETVCYSSLLARGWWTLGRKTCQHCSSLRCRLKFARAYSEFKGLISPGESVGAVMETVGKAGVDNEYAGALVSHLRTQQWL